MRLKWAPKKVAISKPVLALFGIVTALLVTAALLAANSVAPALVRLEHFAADGRTALLADRTDRQHPEIVIVTVDEEVLSRFAGHHYRSPTDRGVLARLVTVIARANPHAIGLDYIFDRPTEAAKDKLLADTLRLAGARVVLGAADLRAGLTPAQRAWQNEFLASTGREAGHLSLTYDRDDIVRYVSRPASAGPYRLGFAELLARDVAPPPERAKFPSVQPIAPDDYRNHRIAWLKVEGQPAENTFRTLPATALLDAETRTDRTLATALGSLLRNRVVLIGGDFADLDRHLTPLTALGAPKLPGVQLHAHMVAQIIDRRSITHTPPWTDPVILLGLTLMGFMIGAYWDVEKFVYGAGVTVLIAADIAVFLTFRTIMPFTLPLFGWLAGAWFGRNAGFFLRSRTAAREDP